MADRFNTLTSFVQLLVGLSISLAYLSLPHFPTPFFLLSISMFCS
jgi:hypothetical protein